MVSGLYLRDPVLINTVGHTAGVLLFGFIIALLIQNRRTHGIRRMRLSLTAATLALAWNIGSLIALASHDPGSILMGIVMTASFSVLSFLPAVLLKVVLQREQRWIWVAGYVVSAGAACLHFGELFSGKLALHQIALAVIAAGFGLLTVIALLVPWRCRSTQPSEPAEWFSLACLLLFTSSFLHFGYEHVSSPWTAEIAWHHVGIPVALIVLLRDYRFLLLDTFVRFLVNSSLATLYIASLLVLNRRFRIGDMIAASMFLTGLALVVLCLSLILFAHLRNVLQSWIGRVIFRRKDVDDCIQKIIKSASTAQSDDELMLTAAKEVATHVGAERFVVLKALNVGNAPEDASVLFGGQQVTDLPSEMSWAEAQTPLRFSSGDARFLLTGPRHGGQRYLSEDLDDLRRLGSVIVEQVERFRSEELKRLIAQAELRALQAQINPHFFFNALNTLYGTIDRRSQQARRIVLNLAEIFRYFLHGESTYTLLSEELRIIEAYLEIEALRLGDRLETEIVVSDGAGSMMIPILSIQPLVENAVKHGVAAKTGRGRVCLRAEKTVDGLLVAVEDTGPGFDWGGIETREGQGVGLDNVRRRLTFCYGPAADLDIESCKGGTVVRFLIPNRADPPRASAQRVNPI